MKQAQHSGDNSNNFQANSLIVHNGLSYLEVRTIALDVCRTELNSLAGQAMHTAWERAEKITDKFLSKLQEQFPGGLGKASDPGFQYALHTLQTEYVKSGDEDLGDVLVDLLVDHTKQEKRGLIKIVLAECMTTVPKLTFGQINALALLFYFRNAKALSVNDLSALAKHIDMYIRPFVSEYAQSEASFQHMQFCGCGAYSSFNSIDLEGIILQKYPGLLTKGFMKSDIDAAGISILPNHPIFIHCLNDATRFQLRAIDLGVLEERFKEYSVSPEDQEKLKNLFNTNMLTNEEVRDKMSSLLPYWGELSAGWNKSGLKSFDLTSVGIAIGHANIKRYSASFADLKVWIN